MSIEHVIVIQAEEGHLTAGVEVAQFIEGYTGSGYITGFGRDGASVEIKVQIPADGFYQVILRLASLKGRKKNRLFIDGNTYGEFVSEQTNGFENANMVTTFFKAGVHTVKVQKSYGEIDIDCFMFCQVAPPGPSGARFDLVNPDASAECLALMKYLKSIYGSAMITGQHTAYADGEELDFIRNVTGKSPAIRGFDLLSYSHATETADPTEHKLIEVERNKGSVEKAIEWTKVHNGIVTLTWHWYAPTGGRDKAFYTKNTDFDLQKAMTPGSKEHELLLADLDFVADQLKKLRDADVPVLWRPLHEAEGRWFWWGAFGPEPYKQLYRFMYDRYTNHHKLNNLIWVWNAPAPEWHPGDEYVDINSIDLYVPEGNYGPAKCHFEYVDWLTRGQKPVALTENGVIPDPDQLIESRTAWLWYMTWGGEFVTGGRATSLEQLQKVYAHPYCITLDQLPDWRLFG